MASTSRRGFLGLLGMGAVAGPAAAKATLADLSVGAGMPLALPPMPHPSGVMVMASAGGTTQYLSKTALRAMGVPQWLRDQWKAEAKYVAALDPDIQAMGSLSLCAKINLQRDRNEKRNEESFWGEEWREARQAFRDKFGYFDW